jgi:hypothetical protein
MLVTASGALLTGLASREFLSASDVTICSVSGSSKIKICSQKF